MIVIDIGNTDIVIGIYSNNKLDKILRFNTKTQKTIELIKSRFTNQYIHRLKIKYKICILSSVVPEINNKILSLFKSLKFNFVPNILDEDKNKSQNYYVNESVGIASGFLLAALHHAGLATLTHTPSPMNFLGEILNRPKNEKAFLLIPVGYPAKDAEVPDISKKPFSKISKFN